MKIIFNILTILFALVLFGCDSTETKPQSKIDNKLDNVNSEAKKVDSIAETKAEGIEDKTKASSKEMEKKEGSHKLSAPVAISFELKDNLLTVTINLNKPVKNLKIQANPLDGLSIEKPSALEKDSYDVPTVLTLPVKLNNQVGRLGIYISGSFNGRQLAHGQTYDFPGSTPSEKQSSEGKRDGNGDLIRVMPATEK